jgi:hypothetical protein
MLKSSIGVLLIKKSKILIILKMFTIYLLLIGKGFPIIALLLHQYIHSLYVKIRGYDTWVLLWLEVTAYGWNLHKSLSGMQIIWNKK